MSSRSNRRRLITELGIFTPTAAVWCYAHGVANGAIAADKKMINVDPLDDGYGIGHCDACNRPIRIRRDVAELQQINRAFGDVGEMLQTGGLVAALCFSLSSGEHIVISAEDEIYVERYHNFFGGDEDHGYRRAQHASVKSALSAIEQLSDGELHRS